MKSLTSSASALKSSGSNGSIGFKPAPSRRSVSVWRVGLVALLTLSSVAPTSQTWARGFISEAECLAFQQQEGYWPSWCGGGRIIVTATPSWPQPWEYDQYGLPLRLPDGASSGHGAPPGTDALFAQLLRIKEIIEGWTPACRPSWMTVQEWIAKRTSNCNADVAEAIGSGTSLPGVLPAISEACRVRMVGFSADALAGGMTCGY
jgi:hypothetical protein